MWHERGMHIERERISVTFHSNNGSLNVFASRHTHEQVLPGKQSRVYYRVYCANRDVRIHIRLDTITGSRRKFDTKFSK